MKKLMLIILSIILLFTVLNLTVFAASKPIGFKDTGNHWAKAVIESLVKRGIINGFEDGTFKPNTSVNVDAFIKMTVVALGNSLENGSTYWASTYIDKSKELGVVDQGEFTDYKRPITRGEMARIMVRAIDEEYPENLTDYQKEIRDFKDTDSHFQEYILKAYVKGIMSGYPDGTFQPDADASRAEAAAMILRLIEPGQRNIPNAPEPEVNPFDREDLNQLISYDTFEPRDGYLAFILYDENKNPSYYTLKEQLNPDINRQLYDLTKVLVDDGNYVSAEYVPEDAKTDSKARVIYKYARSAAAAYVGNAYFDIIFFEKEPRNLYESALRQHETFSRNVSFALTLNRLWWDEHEEGWYTIYHKEKYHDAMIALFGEKTGEKIFTYTFNHYVKKMQNLDAYANLAETKYIDDIQIDFTNDTSSLLYFDFTYLGD